VRPVPIPVSKSNEVTMHQIKLIIAFSIFFVAANFSNAVGEKNITDGAPSTQETDEWMKKIESQLNSINSFFDTITNELDKTKADLNTNLSSEISSIEKQMESAQANISSLSQEFDVNKKNVSDILVAASSPDYTQIGMFWFSMVLVFITVIATYINYRLYRLQTDPDVVVYAMPDPNRPTIINLIIENIGKGIAKNIQFTSDKQIPSRAFGMDDNAPVPNKMDSGPLITGIAEMGPGSKRIITWGQYHGLVKGLGDEVLNISADYSARKTFLKMPWFKSTFSLDIKSFEGTDASDQNWDKKSAESLEKMSRYIKEIASSIKRKE